MALILLVQHNYMVTLTLRHLIQTRGVAIKVQGSGPPGGVARGSGVQTPRGTAVGSGVWTPQGHSQRFRGPDSLALTIPATVVCMCPTHTAVKLQNHQKC